MHTAHGTHTHTKTSTTSCCAHQPIIYPNHVQIQCNVVIFTEQRVHRTSNTETKEREQTKWKEVAKTTHSTRVDEWDKAKVKPGNKVII